MATKDEISGWIWNAQTKMNSYQKIVDDCDDKISRLKPVYMQLGEIKNEFRNARKETEAFIQEKGKWSGEKFNSFSRAGSTLDALCGEYYHRLDAAQDAINVRIGEFEAKKLELVPIIGKLLSQISQWWIEFQNALN